MQARPIFLLLALAAFFCQCKKESTSAPETVDFSCTDHPAVCNLTAANGNFAINVFKQINGEEPAEKNIFISPFSISTALTMTTNGAVGPTLDGMQTALQIAGLNLTDVNNSYKTLLHTLPLLDAATKLKLANSIWHQTDYPVLSSFLQSNSNYYNSEILPVNFREPAVIGQVNSWVEDHTDGLIKETITELDPSTVMLLINAIYFKGTWRTKFDAANTEQADFFAPSGTEQVAMMHIAASTFPYFSNDLFQAIDLPYGDSIYSMSVFLPKAGHNVNEVVAGLNGNTWAQWLSAFHPQEVELFLPKFKMAYDKKLKRPLMDMGMDLAFSDAADFSNMIQDGGVKIDEVIHKSFVEVDEKGTEAAAVTVVVIVETSVPVVPVIQANHPFLFVIRDNKTNSILFMGKMMNPNAN